MNQEIRLFLFGLRNIVIKAIFNYTIKGVTINYVDPANLVYSYTESPYFEDIYYVGEVKTIPVNELAKQFPHLSESDLEDIMKNKSNNRSNYNSTHTYNKEDNKYYPNYCIVRIKT